MYGVAGAICGHLFPFLSPPLSSPSLPLAQSAPSVSLLARAIYPQLCPGGTSPLLRREREERGEREENLDTLVLPPSAVFTLDNLDEKIKYKAGDGPLWYSLFSRRYFDRV